MKHFDSNEFLATLNSYDWQCCHVDDVNTCLANLNNNILKALNKHAPMVDKRVKTINKPAWLNKEIIHEMHYRDRLKANGLWNDYKKSRNRVTNMIKQYKSKHYIRGIQDARGNSKKMWKLVKDITGRGTNTGHIILETNNEHIVEPKQITNVLNQHFLNVTEKVTVSLPKDESYKTPDELVTWISDRLPNAVKFDIPLITENEVLKALSALDITKSTGVDKISPMFLKISSASISPHLTHIINTSIKSNTFPDLWKTAIVYPLHKSGSKANLDNYRPISVLCVMPKIIERHVHHHFYKFLIQYDLINEFQSGSRKHHSSNTSLTHMFSDWINNLDKGNIIGNVRVDMRKAFDVINFDILLYKLKMYGCSLNTVMWLKTYIQNRNQYVRNIRHNMNSDTHETKYGVPQGSILGPLLFVLYINDFFICIECKYSQYVDDTDVYAIGHDIYEVEHKLNHDLLKIEKLCENTRLVINQNKCNSMLLCSSQKLRFPKGTELELLFGGSPLCAVNSQKILGVYFDSHLKFDDHINFICNKMICLSGLLWRIKEFLPEATRLLFYNSYFVPVMDYCINVWGQSSKSLLQKIYQIQKRILRNVSCDYLCEDNELFHKYNNIMTIYERIEFQTAILVYKCLFEVVPSYLQNFF